MKKNVKVECEHKWITHGPSQDHGLFVRCVKCGDRAQMVTKESDRVYGGKLVFVK